MTAFIVIALIVFLGVALLVFLSGIALYARVMKLRTAVISARSQMDNAIKKRDDLAPGPLPAKLKDNITAAVSDYNAAVRIYNSALATFPASLIVKWYNLKKAASFDKEIS